MIFDKIRRNLFGIIICSSVILLLLWAKSFSNLDTSNLITGTGNTMPLQQLLVKWVYTDALLSIVLGLVCVLFTALLLYRLNESHLFITSREPLLSILFVLLISAFPDSHYLRSIHPALIFLLLSMNSVFSTYRRDYAFKEVYLGALYLSVASLFYAPVIYCLLAFFICLSLMKPVLWRDWVIMLAGLLTPYVFALFYFFFTEGDWQIPFLLFYDNIIIELPLKQPVFSVAEWIFVIYVTLISIVAVLRSFFVHSSSLKVKGIRINSAFIWIFFIAIVCSVFYTGNRGIETIMLASFPLAAILTNLFSTLKNNVWANIIMFLLILSIVSIQIPEEWFRMLADTFKGWWEFVIDLF